jgi:hypothetical protein
VIPVHVMHITTAAAAASLQLQPIDVSFYGHLNEHRANILHDLRSANLTVRYEHDVLGVERDDRIRQSKVVLNLHYLPDAALEVHRINPLLMLGKCVVSEPSIDAQLDAQYYRAIVFAYSSDIVHTARKLVNDKLQRQWWESNALTLSNALQSNVAVISEGFMHAIEAQSRHSKP